MAREPGELETGIGTTAEDGPGEFAFEPATVRGGGPGSAGGKTGPDVCGEQEACPIFRRRVIRTPQREPGHGLAIEHPARERRTPAVNGNPGRNRRRRADPDGNEPAPPAASSRKRESGQGSREIGWYHVSGSFRPKGVGAFFIFQKDGGGSER